MKFSEPSFFSYQKLSFTYNKESSVKPIIMSDGAVLPLRQVLWSSPKFSLSLTSQLAMYVVSWCCQPKAGETVLDESYEQGF